MAQNLHRLAEIAPVVRLLVTGFAEDGAIVERVTAAVGHTQDVVSGGAFAVVFKQFEQAVAAHGAAVALAAVGLVNRRAGKM